MHSPLELPVLRWFQWLLACTVGIAGSVFTLAHLGRRFVLLGCIRDSVPPYLAQLAILAIYGAIIGAILGSFQGLILGQLVRGAGWWVLMTVIGLAVSSVLRLIIWDALDYALGSPSLWLWPTSFTPTGNTLLALAVVGCIADVAYGAIIGFFQWITLRRSVGRAGWWILTNALAWIASFWIGMYVGAGLRKIVFVPQASNWFDFSPAFLAGWKEPTEYPVIGVLVGVITGSVLIYLLAKRPPTTTDRLDQAVQLSRATKEK